ncbi:CAT RNA binding domain protein [Collinsella stercoris DSM 13279]|uniref:CAT RNA binding domain protein n=1 Tax=Collinsella stercoris DSM 13279 TaxID=445975 RepID=B6GAQ9_9ACTN|nr:CAT RNA binding domain protein [Collinsella stercoris DSM 13279]
MLILKKINNNVALASSDAGEEIVVFGKGVGFHEMPYELEDESVIQRVFRDVDEKCIGGFANIADDVLLVASDIVAMADKALDLRPCGQPCGVPCRPPAVRPRAHGRRHRHREPAFARGRLCVPARGRVGPPRHRARERAHGRQPARKRDHLYRPAPGECRGGWYGQLSGHGPRHEEHRDFGARHAGYRGAARSAARPHVLCLRALCRPPAFSHSPPYARRLQGDGELRPLSTGGPRLSRCLSLRGRHQRVP